ncbi:hypothetical protein, unlikely [Trypanosoma brucei brucei TREU927]|uniref:Uncharacterized protein n=1 Tax=Trypanosoma brucei brucei (strain 927/4 GUTat10.1) TaxID=185431 RepID=Q4GYM5_TRYB2|nr:hypothetical protein, unlikely [Trypanosoma brucei brucei TREU927]CAJ16559.1 hypothetical protein, unlikely [Trypanosoma brucei brucei TREU927]
MNMCLNTFFSCFYPSPFSFFFFLFLFSFFGTIRFKFKSSSRIFHPFLCDFSFARYTFAYSTGSQANTVTPFVSFSSICAFNLQFFFKKIIISIIIIILVRLVSFSDFFLSFSLLPH